MKLFPLKIMSLTLALVLSTSASVSLASSDDDMNEEEAQQIWDEYYERIKQRRLAEAAILWSDMQSSGVTDETILALDFKIFCGSEMGAKNVEEQLSENYNISLKHDTVDNVWIVEGTTRPTGFTFNKEMHMDWVNFMTDASAQYGCVFASWALESPKLRLIFESNTIETNLP